MNCKLCNSPNTGPMPFEVPPEAGSWVRCRDCGSDTATHTYDDVKGMYQDRAAYDAQFEYTNLEALKKDCMSNCDWFDHYHQLGANRDFLDVGCWHGAALSVMQDLGWSVHGFDVSKPPYYGPHVTVAPMFHRWLFPRRYAAVLCREVWEHVPSPDLLLHELHGVTEPNGLVQVQTPKAIDSFHGIPYQKQHLHIASVGQFRKMLDAAMLDVVDWREWDLGMAALCRARA